eukprot:COSAG01_NODE_71605_length_255_cov_0.929487_1_plen_44_part_10
MQRAEEPGTPLGLGGRHPRPAAMAAADYEMEEEVRRMRAVFHEV